MRFFLEGVILAGLSASGAAAAPQTRVCGKYSTILLNEGEKAEVNGAGQSSLFLLVKGPKGNWLFFDSMAEPARADGEGILIRSKPGKVVYRRSHDKRIYAIQPAPSKLVDGKIVKTGVMGVDVMRQALDHPAITGENSDLAVIDRVLPGQITRCDLRFVAGQGLVPRGAK